MRKHKQKDSIEQAFKNQKQINSHTHNRITTSSIGQLSKVFDLI